MNESVRKISFKPKLPPSYSCAQSYYRGVVPVLSVVRINQYGIVVGQQDIYTGWNLRNGDIITMLFPTQPLFVTQRSSPLSVVRRHK